MRTPQRGKRPDKWSQDGSGLILPKGMLNNIAAPKWSCWCGDTHQNEDAMLGCSHKGLKR